MKLCRISIFCFVGMGTLMAQAGRISVGSTVEERRINEKQAELEERRQEIELMTLEAQMQAQSRALQDSVRMNKYFGYRFFRSGAETDNTMYENLPVPKGYTVGPGDNIQVLLWGQTQLQSSYPVDRDGRIFVPEIGPIDVAGKTLDELREFLRSEFVRIYATIDSKKDRTYMDVSLGALQSINVQIVGEVRTPGIHTVHPFSTVVTALTQAGGVDTTGSLRSIRVMRDDELYSEVDLYDLMLRGERTTEFRLREGDLIMVPVRRSTATVSGEVYRPGIYEMKPGESIRQLISYAGGLKSTASSVVELRRISPWEVRANHDDPIEIAYLDYGKLNPKEIVDGDVVNVHRIMTVSKEVIINGQVKRPGVYAFEDSLRLRELLDLAGGINDEDFLRSVNTEKIDITRRDPESDYSEVISLSLNDVLNNGETANIYLDNHDQVTVYPNLKFLPARTVQISGEILLPGVYPILGDFETIESIIERAGGFTSRAFPEGIVLMRAGQRLVVEGMGNTMRDGDVITIPETSDVIEVSGAVYNPGLISFQKGRSVNEYIRMAGGLRPDGNKNDLMVIYADGSVKPKRLYLNPRPEPGCTIQVNSRTVQTPVEALLVFVEGISTTLTQLITTYVIITQIGSILSGSG